MELDAEVPDAYPHLHRYVVSRTLTPDSGSAGADRCGWPLETEVGYLLAAKAGAHIEAQFLHAIAVGDFTPVELLTTDYERMSQLVEQYADLPLGTSDASVIALAERLDITEIATLDLRHFTVVRPQHVPAFTLLP
jgi:predicted nucleic acid-binding protein